ncbi:phage tail assembly protein [Sphingomonas sp.]|uniref:phage tail assembly protein n=1 Tax=Sphingomonas sp. TaxID=28214 RepID=UPI002ED9015E
METQTTDSAPKLRKFTLDENVMVGDQVLIAKGTEITVRKPGSGELRGLTLMALSQLDVAALHELAPRITMPVIHKNAAMDPADLMQFGGEVMDFLLPTAAKQAASPTE